MIGKKERAIFSAIILATIIVVPSAISYSFADSEVKNKIKYNCKIEGSGNGDLGQVSGPLTSTTNPSSGSTGSGATGTGTSGSSTTGSESTDSYPSTGSATGTGGDGGSNNNGPFNIGQAEENKLKEKRNSCTFVSTVVSTDNH